MMWVAECPQREEVGGACQSKATSKSSAYIVDPKCRGDIADCKVSQAFSKEAEFSVWAGVCAQVYDSYTNIRNMIVK
jgi:hypothetical protein